MHEDIVSRSGKQMAGLPKVGHSFIGIEEHINRGTHKQMAGLPYRFTETLVT